MARTGEPAQRDGPVLHQHGGQRLLNHTAPTPRAGATPCSAKVVKGEDVVESIKKVRTTRKGFHDDVPFDAVVIDKAVAL